jgi:hypothetical protein
MILNKKKEIIKGLLLIAALIFFIWGMYIKINVDTIYADGTVHFEKESKYVTLDNQFTVLPDSFETKYIDDFDDGTKVTCKFLRLPFDYYVLNDVYEQKETE